MTITSYPLIASTAQILDLWAVTIMTAKTQSARRLGEAKVSGERVSVPQVVLRAALEIERSVFFSIVMIVVAFAGLFSWTGSTLGVMDRVTKSLLGLTQKLGRFRITVKKDMCIS